MSICLRNHTELTNPSWGCIKLYWTFQDFQENNTPEALITIIEAHKSSRLYREAIEADAYDQKRNTEILKYQKYLYGLSGAKYVDTISANNKLCSGFFPQFITQENQHVLGNGCSLSDEAKRKLGNRFDTDLQRCGRNALLHGVTFGYWAGSRLYPFPVTEFAPLYDEDTGVLRAGVRFWQVDPEKPLNFTLYDQDGFTQYRRKDGVITVVSEKQAYKDITLTSKAFGTEIIGAENYSTLPIKQLNGNPQHQSELVGIKSQIDAYDRVKSGFTNDLDEAAFVYWVLNGAAGMTNEELQRFRDVVRLTGVVLTEEGQTADLQTKDIPYQARMEYLAKLESDLYRDFGAVDTKALSGSNMVTAQIRAAYAALDAKCDMYEYELIEFVQAVLELVGITGETPKFKRGGIQNDLEETQRVMLMRDELDDETTLEMLPGIQPEEIKDILRKREEQSQSRYTAMELKQPQQTEQEPTE